MRIAMLVSTQLLCWEKQALQAAYRTLAYLLQSLGLLPQQLALKAQPRLVYDLLIASQGRRPYPLLSIKIT